MNRFTSLSVLCATVALVPACTVEDVASEAQSIAQKKTTGIVLRGTGAHKSLEIAASMKLDADTGIDGVYLKRVQVARKGHKSFTAYCGLGGAVAPSAVTATLSCTKYTKDVTDNERLEFRVEQRGESFALTGIELTGSALEAQRDTLTKGAPGEIELVSKKASADPFLNPFAGTALAASVLAPLVGELAYEESTGEMKPIVAFEYSLNEYFSVWATASFAGNEHGATLDFSLAKTDWHPQEGLASLDEIRARALGALPKPPVCEEEGPAGSAQSPVPSIENAFDPLGGPSFGLSHEVSLSALPAAVAKELKKAGKEIENRSFGPDSDYTAGVVGYYAIHRSCSDASIVAYVVWGAGSGEPDYHDGIVVGVDLSGKRVYEEEMDG